MLNNKVSTNISIYFSIVKTTLRDVKTNVNNTAPQMGHVNSLNKKIILTINLLSPAPPPPVVDRCLMLDESVCSLVSADYETGGGDGGFC